MPRSAPIHLRPAAPLAERVLLPGDPHRALAIAQSSLEGARMFNHRRGLWGYTGDAPGLGPVTVQSTGMGGPSAAIVAHELIELGARTLVRVGTCGALDRSLKLGTLLAVDAAIAADGASGGLGAEGTVRADPALVEALAAAAGEVGTVVSSDLFYDRRPELADGWRAAGARAVEMEAAAILRVAALGGAAGGCLLAVTDRLGPDGERERLDDEGIEKAGRLLGEAALAALRAVTRR